MNDISGADSQALTTILSEVYPPLHLQKLHGAGFAAVHVDLSLFRHALGMLSALSRHFTASECRQNALRMPRECLKHAETCSASGKNTESLICSAHMHERGYLMPRKDRIGVTAATNRANDFHVVLSMTRIAIFASGAGSNALKIIEYFRKHETIAVALIVCNRPGAGVIDIAESNHIPVVMIDKERFFRGDGHIPDLRGFNIDFIVLAGFLWKIPVTLINAYRNSIINIHPALLPHFGGKGMYGMNVHTAIIQAGEMESGITIHYVDEHYDNGDIIFQEKVRIDPSDTPETLASRIHALEHEHFPRIIEQVITLKNQQ